MTPNLRWAILFGALTALWIAGANAGTAKWYVVEWYIKLTPMPDVIDCTKLAAERAKVRSTACLTAAEVAKLKLKAGK